MTRTSLCLRQKTLARVVLLSVTGLMFLSAAGVASSSSDEGKRDLDANGLAILPAPADKQIAEALKRISAPEIEQNITTLVTFHNRSTISSVDTDLPQGQGVTAAA